MKWFIIPFGLSFCIGVISCSEEDSPEPDLDKHSTIVGNYIYSVIEGDAQIGVPGQYLENEIKIRITDFKGKPVNRNIQLVLTDQSGKISYENYDYDSDTLRVRWKLGCESADQIIKLRDLNVCGIAKSGCIEVDILDISASATGEITSGWYSPCSSLGNMYYHDFLVNDKRLAIIAENQMVSTDDPVASTWDFASFPYDLNYGQFDLLSSGEVFYAYYNQKYLSSVDATLWKRLDLPFYSSYVDMEVTDNGNYFIVEQSSSKVYKSTNGDNWTEYLDLSKVTNGSGYYPQALSVDGNSIYILTHGNLVVEIDELDKTTIHEFSSGSWSTNDDLFDFDLEVLDGRAFLIDNYYDYVYVLDLNSKSVESYDAGNYAKLFKSEGKMYVMNNISTIKEWTQHKFSVKSYPVIDYYDYSYGYSFGFFKGGPVAFDSGGHLYYYVN